MNLKAVVFIFLLVGVVLFGSFMVYGLVRDRTFVSANPPPIEDYIVSEMLKRWIPEGDDLQNERGVEFTPDERMEEPDAQGVVLADTTNGFCAGADVANFDCYELHYQNLVTEEGLDRAMEDIKSRYQTNSYVRSQCHPLMHVIGRTSYLLFPSVHEAFAGGDPFCWSGHHHGVMEAVISETGLSGLPDVIDSICDGIPGKNSYSFDYYNCLHGLGHGVMAVTNTELFDSLAQCDGLSGEWEEKSCASGVFMENVIVDGKNHFTKYLKGLDDPHYPCDVSPEKYKHTCYLMQTSYMLKIDNGDFQKTFEWCSEAELAYRTTCYASLGRDASGRSISDVTRTIAWCSLATDRAQLENCIIGAAKDFVSYHHSDSQANHLCDAVQDEEVRLVCHSTVEGYYKTFGA